MAVAYRVPPAVRRTFAVLLLAACFGMTASRADATTLVFVHGKNGGLESTDSIRVNYWTQEMIRASTRNYQARYLVVAYDGTQYYWDEGARISSQINAYLDQYPNERLIWVCHSYGGINARWILCNSAPGSPYYNYRGANYARINSATDYVITLASPHGGSEVADLGYTLQNSAFTAWIVTLVDNDSNSAEVLTSAHLQSASQTWLRDSLRSKAFYTVAGTSTLNHAWHLNDYGLWVLDVLAPFSGSNDGLVAPWSAHYIGAPGYDWFNTSANHDHNRHNDSPAYIGNVIGQYGW
jgi:triacylglycerol esterase/lipase EstA (alpha/beta hydrolase family)